MASVEEVLTMMREVEKVFSTTDELETLSFVVRADEEIKEHMRKEQQIVRDVIKELCERTKESERLATRVEPPTLHAKRMAALQQEKDALAREIAELEQEVKYVQHGYFIVSFVQCETHKQLSRLSITRDETERKGDRQARSSSRRG